MVQKERRVVEATKNKMTWLLLGSNGQLGRCLQDVLTELNISFVASTREDVDITNIDSVQRSLVSVHPSVVVNMAAWTDVDGAESHIDEAFLVNAFGAENVAKAAALIDVPLVHISTDYVFDGDKTAPYLTTDLTNPLSVYGRSKLKGEQLVWTAHPAGTWIVRTAWLYSQYGKNFARTIARKGLTGANLSVVNDSFGQPTSAIALAKQIVALVQTSPPPGTFHGTSSGRATWFDFAQSILEPLEMKGVLTPVASDAFPTVAPRPQYSVLDHSDWSTHGIPNMAHWKDSLSDVLPIILNSVKD